MRAGQRYDIVFTADQEINNYWFRAVAQLRCSFQAKPNDIRAIFRYEGANETEDPTSLGYDYTDECVDFPISSLVPVVSKSVKKPRAFSTNSMLLTADRVNNTDGVIQWMVNKSSHRVDWWSPSVLQHQEGRIFQSSLNNYNISLGQVS